jgi:hypothetical protein
VDTSTIDPPVVDASASVTPSGPSPVVALDETSILIEAIELARGLRVLCILPAQTYAAGWLDHARGHLEDRLDREFRGSQPPRVTTEAAAMAILKGVAQELRTSGRALLQAAEELKNRAAVMPAQRAFVAHQRAMKVADDLVPQ